MLPLAVHLAVAIPGGARDQCLGARGNVRLLLAMRNWDSSMVEEVGDGFSDYSVRF